MSDDPLLVLFIVVAVGLRLIFWVYTDRIWEDFLITLNPARNFWDGNGLTHHVPEPRVYSFTSTISILVLLIGEAFGHAIALNRVLSLIAAVLTISFASRIARHLAIHRIGEVVCLSFLATDHLQIFFGMAGMETQIATAIALGTVFFCISANLIWFGIFAGLAVLARPDMVILDAVCFGYLALKYGRAAWAPARLSAAVIAPWVIFATLYYGSPIPQTIAVKSAVAGIPDLDHVLVYAANFWKQFAPFWEFWFVNAIPVPDFVPPLVVCLTAVCAVLALLSQGAGRSQLLLIGVVVFAFAAYLIRYTVGPYFMWYAPPFFALYFLLVGAGLSELRRYSPVLAFGVAIVIMAGYAVPFFFTLPLDRRMQKDVDVAVRGEVGKMLNQRMGKRDSVFLEPLGYIGIEIRDRMIFDNPGLGSKLSFAAVRQHGWGAIEDLKPDFVVFRPSELDAAKRTMPETLSSYDEVAHIKGDTGSSISQNGLTYKVYDDEFWILHRRK